MELRREIVMNLFILQLRGELRKLFGRKRTYIGFGAFLLIEILILILLQLPKVQRSFRHMIERSGYVFENYFSGTTLAFEILRWTIFFLGALYLALVAGDVVLCRPVSRWRVLVVKYLACVIYTFALIFFIGITALIAGLLRQGTGGLFVFAPVEGVFALFDFREGLQRYLLALPFLSLSLLSISSLGFTFSCFNMKPAAATIVTLSVFFVDLVFRMIPYFESLKQWFFTAHMSAWLNIFQVQIPRAQMIEDYAYLIAADLTLVIIGMINFQQRDFKS